jgi:hypothetical protein
VTLGTFTRVAHAVGRQLRMELVAKRVGGGGDTLLT